MKTTAALAASVLAVAVCTALPVPAHAATYPNPGTVTGSTGVHDPGIVRRTDGTYLVPYTGNNIVLKTSSDRIAFHDVGVAFPSGAPWTSAYTGGSAALWAPDISYRGGKYLMYYAASTFGSNHSAIFLATSTSGNPGTWTNSGLVIESQTANNYNAIDPNLYVDTSGRWWLTFGSFWSGIQQIELNPSTGKPLNSTVTNVAGRGGGPIEAPFLFKHGSYYYLYVSFDYCCRGAASTYRIMVGRATSPNGPFVDKNGTRMTSGGGSEILAGHGSIHGPGGQSVFTDGGTDVLVYHYYDDRGASKLGINLLGYDAAGWPYVY
jgi:arabinan endo-1,5-alpha-L-arabinosidase